MKPHAHFALYFAGGIVAPMLLWSTVSVYAFDQYERAWGHGGSVQVLWALSLAAGIAALFSVATALRWAAPRRIVSSMVAFSSGVSFFLVSAFVAWALGLYQGSVSGPTMLLWFIAGPALVSALLVRAVGRIEAP
jgi:hypothetical protein